MASVDLWTADHTDDVFDQQVIDGDVDADGHLILTTRGGTPIDAGLVKGSKWGTTPTWAFIDSTDVDVDFPGGAEPLVGDHVISLNGFSLGEVYVVTAVTGPGKADVAYVTSLRGPAGADGEDGTDATPINAWPVGSIFIAAVSTNPATLLGGGTWARYGQGRVLVSQDSGQAEFDTVNETGGAKTHTLTTAEIPSHTHTLFGTVQAANGTQRRQLTDIANGDNNVQSGPTGGGGAHNNLQPYIVVYMWQRTA